MKKYIINGIMKSIKETYDYDSTKLAEIKYGLETLYLTITKTVILLAISIVFGYLKEILLFMLFYGTLRLTGFGLHAKKSWHCWVGSFILFIGVPLICKYCIFPLWFKLVLSCLSFITIIICAPADTQKRPLIHKNKRIFYKIITIIISAIYLFFIYYLDYENIINVLILSLVTEALMVNPLSYRIMGVSYNNYKHYRNKSSRKE